jgi:hypothetical protein
MKAKLPSTAVGRRRLLKLADLLEADARKKKGIKFDFTEWGQADDPNSPMSCGTTACALGLAALSGAFARNGLTATIQHFGWIEIKMESGARFIEAGAELFKISYEESEFLFTSGKALGRLRKGAKAERAVAQRIRNFVAGRVTAE